MPAWSHSLRYRWNPDREALKGAARTAIVLSVAFALVLNLIGGTQTPIFTMFGCFALLVMVDFAGPRGHRLIAYVLLAAAGAFLIVIGTLCSDNVAVATIAMAIVGFVILFSGVIDGYLAAATTAAILAFVLSVMIEADPSAIPDRLLGWGIASGASLLGLLLIFPVRSETPMRKSIAELCGAIAEMVERPADATAATSARDALRALRARFVSTPYRPSGPTGSTAAMAALPDELGWLYFLLIDHKGDADQGLTGESATAVGQALRASAEMLGGHDSSPDLDRLARARRDVIEPIVKASEQPDGGCEEALTRESWDRAYRVRTSVVSATRIWEYSLAAAGVHESNQGESIWQRTTGIMRWGTVEVEATEKFAAEHASVRSVWFRNSVRGAIGLALAVFLGQSLGVEHSFWVVLGTLSVLRSSAHGTGTTIVQGIAGTVVGIIVASLALLAVGGESVLLWILLPACVLFSAYAPKALSFAAGQAGFSIVVIILFNLIDPVGWSVGLVRVEDVLIGSSVSLVVGLLFWPRGAAKMLRRSLALAYSTAAEYLVAAVGYVCEGGSRDECRDRSELALKASHRLDAAYRQYLSERSSGPLDRGNLVALVGGVGRLQRGAYAISSLGRQLGDAERSSDLAAAVRAQGEDVGRWYRGLGQTLAGSDPHPRAGAPDQGSGELIELATTSVEEAEDRQSVDAALIFAWSTQHLRYLVRLEKHLSEPVSDLVAANGNHNGGSAAVAQPG